MPCTPPSPRDQCGVEEQLKSILELEDVLQGGCSILTNAPGSAAALH